MKFKTLKTIKKIVLISSILLVIFPRIAFAIIPSFIDFFMHSLEGVEEATLPFLWKQIKLFLFYFFSLVALIITSDLLDSAIIAQPQWITLGEGNLLVRAGFNFTLGLANMILILILIYVAFLIILKFEEAQTKRMLIKLFIVAFLVNFSLLFVRILVDLSNVFYNTLLNATRDPATNQPRLIARELANQIVGPAWRVFLDALFGFIWLATSFVIPGVATARQLAIVTGLATAFLPTVLGWLFRIFVFSSLSGIFILYCFLFTARPFVIMILAVLSPLVFLCTILPQTEGYWKQWLRYLLQWLFLGIFLLFFMILGAAGIGILTPPTDFPRIANIPPPIFGWIQYRGWVRHYLGIFVYLVVLLFFSKKYMPEIADLLIEQGRTLGGIILGRGIKPLGGRLWRRTKELTRQSFAQAPPGSWRRRRLERFQEWSQYQPRGRFARTIGTVIPFHYAVRGIGQALGPALIEAEKAEIKKAEVETEKIETPELAYSKFRQAIGTNRLTEAAGILSKSIEKGGAFKRRFLQELRNEPDIVIRVASVANRVGATQQAERIGRAFIHLADQMGLARTRAELIDEARDREINDFAPGFWREPTAMARIQRNYRGDRLARMAEEFGPEFVRDYMTARVALVDRVGIDEVVRRNPAAALYLATTPAQLLGFRSPRGLTPRQIRNIIRRVTP